MSCIKNEIIQKYIDGEATPKEVSLIQNHIITCEKCAVRIDEQHRLADGIKKAINLLAKDGKEIPEIVLPPNPIRKRFFTRKILIYSISAACILFFVFILSNKNEPKERHQVTIIHSLGQEVDANRPITKQQIIINVIDSNGEVTQY